MIIEIILSTVLMAFAQENAKGAPTTTQAPPWLEIESKISEYASKIKSKEDSIKKLIEAKKSLPENSPDAKSIMDDMVREHKELQTLIEDYERNKNALQYRYPERGAKANRKYDKKKKQSLEDMEKAYGIDGNLTRSLQVMRKHYGKDGPAEGAKPAVTTTTQRPPTKPIDQSEPLIISK